MQTGDRIARLRERMAEQQINALLVTDPVNVRYLTGFTGDSTYFLVSETDARVLSDRRYEEQLQRECGQLPAEIRGPERLMPQLIADVLAGVGLRQLWLEDHAVTLQLHGQLAEKVTNCQLHPSTGLVAGLRAVKDAGELETLRRAIHCAERSFGVLRASLREGGSELEAAYLLESAIRSFGGEGIGFDTIIAVGDGAALPHYRPADTKIAAGRELLVDWGARVDGYTSDMTRTLSIGAIDPRVAEIYPIVLEAHLAAIERAGPGVAYKDVDAAARSVIERAGYGEAFGHGLGHGIGLEVHENPRLASISTGELVPGMVITIEPGIYLPGRAGVRIEDDVLITETGSEVLCSLPKGLEENRVIL
jgi:Xaa-Pro aminopeptidase